MEYKFNSLNENYITIARYDIVKAHSRAHKENEEEISNIFYDILNTINNYERKNIQKNDYSLPLIYISIKTKSKIGQYILSNQEIPEYITLKEIIHALLVCISKNDWQYYEEIAKLIQKFKEENYTKLDYTSFIKVTNNEITNFIINSQHYYTDKFNSDLMIYLYHNGKITRKKIEKQEQKNTKVRRRAI